MNDLDSLSLSPALRIKGGFLGALSAAFRGWWREIFWLTSANMLWTLALFTIIALPPATAAIFYMARQVLREDYFVGWQTFWQPFRRYWQAAWRWGAIFLLVVVLLVSNLWFYQGSTGIVWRLLRWGWATILVLWLMLNLFFWPLWFVQEESYRTLRITWRNSLVFMSTNPLPLLFLTPIIFLLTTISFLFGIPLGIIFIAWTALLTTATLAAYLPDEEEV